MADSRNQDEGEKKMTPIYKSGLYWKSAGISLAAYAAFVLLVPIPKAISIALVLAVQIMYTIHLRIGYKGIPTFLGRRLKSPIYVPEGTNPLPLGWGSVPILIVDRNTNFTERRPDDPEKLRELPEGEHYEFLITDSNNVLVRLRAAIRWYINDLSAAVDSGLRERTSGHDGEGSTVLEDVLIDFYEQILLGILRKWGWERVSKNVDKHAEFAKGALSERVKNNDREMGIVVVATPITRILPPDVVLEAASDKLVEKEQQDSEVTQGETWEKKRKLYVRSGTPEDRVDAVILADTEKLGPDKGFTVDQKIFGIPALDNLALRFSSMLGKTDAKEVDDER